MVTGFLKLAIENLTSKIIRNYSAHKTYLVQNIYLEIRLF